MRRTIQIECSQFATGAYWVYGLEVHAVDVTVEYPDDLDALDDDTLLEMADDEASQVKYIE